MVAFGEASHVPIAVYTCNPEAAPVQQLLHFILIKPVECIVISALTDIVITIFLCNFSSHLHYVTFYIYMGYP